MPDIKHSIRIAAPPETVFPLISTAKGFAEWWAADVTEAAGAVELGFFNRATVYRLQLEASEAPARAEWRCETGKEWAGTRIAFTSAADGPDTLLRFMHRDWAAETDYFVSCNTTWGELMFRLKAAAEAKAPGPLFLAAGMAY
jgi:uncharacterized protein YndB with AHSA1/START domain